jgi:chemotaxis-related protein WspD
MAQLSARAMVVQTCYKQVGVYGDGSCPELVEHVHCRNCPVFATAAAEILDRELPAGYRAAWTLHHSQTRKESQAELSSLLLFRIGSEWLALRTEVIEEVASLRTVHPLPHRRDGVVTGVANIRGELLICVALAPVLCTQAPPAASSVRACARLIVLRRAASRFATQVDEVHGTLRVAPRELASPPATLGKTGTFTRGVLSWQGRSVGCIDDELLFHSLERRLG